MNGPTASLSESTKQRTFTTTWECDPGQEFHGYGSVAAGFDFSENYNVKTGLPRAARNGAHAQRGEFEEILCGHSPNGAGQNQFSA